MKRLLLTAAVTVLLVSQVGYCQNEKQSPHKTADAASSKIANGLYLIAESGKGSQVPRANFGDYKNGNWLGY